MTQTERRTVGEEHQGQPTRPVSFPQGVMLSSAGTGITIAILFLETMVAVRLLDTTDYGVYVLLVAVVNFFVMVIDFGCKTAATKLIASSDPIRQAALVNTALIFRLLAIGVFTVLILLGQVSLSLLDSSGSLLQYAIYIPVMLAVTSLDDLLLGVFQGFQSYKKMAIAQIARSVLRLVLTITFLVGLDLGMTALIYSWIISFAVSNLYLYLTLPISRRFVLQRPLLTEMLHFGFPIQMSNALRFVSIRVNVIFLGTLIGPTSVALYAVAARIPEALQRLSESYTAVFFPTMADLLAQGKHGLAVWTLNRSLRLLSFASALVALTAVLFSQQIVTLLFTDKYADSGLVFALLMIAFHMFVLINIMGYALTAAGYPGRSLGENSIRTTVNLLGNLVLIPILGTVGPAIARLLSVYISNPINVWLLRRSGISVTVAPFLKQTVLLLLCAAFFWWAQPAGFVYKFAIIGVFAVLSIVLTTVGRDDLGLILPETLARQLGVLNQL